jgi:hypothetical protein
MSQDWLLDGTLCAVCGRDVDPRRGDPRIRLAPFTLVWHLRCTARLLQQILRVSRQRQREFEGLEAWWT